MESAKLNVVHFNSEDVIATSGIVRKGDYDSSFYFTGEAPTNNYMIYYYPYTMSDTDTEHFPGDPTITSYPRDFFIKENSTNYYLENEPLIPGVTMFENDWYDYYVDGDNRYFYKGQ